MRSQPLLRQTVFSAWLTGYTAGPLAAELRLGVLCSRGHQAPCRPACPAPASPLLPSLPAPAAHRAMSCVRLSTAPAGEQNLRGHFNSNPALTDQDTEAKRMPRTDPRAHRLSL